jgi:hypothetical protein
MNETAELIFYGTIVFMVLIACGVIGEAYLRRL